MCCGCLIPVSNAGRGSSSCENRRSECEVAEGQGVEDLGTPHFHFLSMFVVMGQLWSH